jgi:hypothetical protein
MDFQGPGGGVAVSPRALSAQSLLPRQHDE